VRGERATEIFAQKKRSDKRDREGACVAPIERVRVSVGVGGCIGYDSANREAVCVAAIERVCVCACVCIGYNNADREGACVRRCRWVYRV
jgi:hypothetical protein